MYNINLQHFKVISAIEKEGSMTKASEKLNLTQSALSHHLKELEKNIGTVVFERRNKKLWITEAGKKILNSSDVILNELNKLNSELKTLNSGNSGTIRISTECYTTYSWLPKLIRDFNKKYPDADIQIVVEATKKPIQYLLNRQLDIAIIGRKKDHISSLKYTPFFKDELVVIVNKDNALAKHKAIVPSDFKDQVLIVYDSDDNDIDLLQMVLKPNNIELSKIIKMQLTEVIIEMIKSNLGIALMAKWQVSPLMTNELSMLSLKDDFAKRTWHLVTNNSQSELLKKFIGFAIENLKK